MVFGTAQQGKGSTRTMVFAASIVTLAIIGFLSSAIFIVVWTIAFARSRGNPDRVRYPTLAVIDFIGLPSLALVVLALSLVNLYLHGVVAPASTASAAQRLLTFVVVGGLSMLRLARFATSIRDNRDLPLPGGTKEPDHDRIDA